MAYDPDLERTGSRERTVMEIAFVLVVLALLAVAVSATWLTDDDDDVERVEAVEGTTTITIDGLGGPTSTSAPTTTAPITTTTAPTTTAPTTTAPPTTAPPTTAPPTTAPTTIVPTTLPPPILPPTTLPPTTSPPDPGSSASADGSVITCRGAPGGTSATIRVVHRSGPPAAFRVTVEYYDGAGALNGSGSATSRVVNPQTSQDVTVFIASTASSGSCRLLGAPVSA